MQELFGGHLRCLPLPQLDFNLTHIDNLTRICRELTLRFFQSGCWKFQNFFVKLSPIPFDHSVKVDESKRPLSSGYFVGLVILPKLVGDKFEEGKELSLVSARVYQAEKPQSVVGCPAHGIAPIVQNAARFKLSESLPNFPAALVNLAFLCKKIEKS